jgi:hypothetical protein
MSKINLLEQLANRRHDIANKIYPYKIIIECGEPTKEDLASYDILNNELNFIDKLLLDFKA